MVRVHARAHLDLLLLAAVGSEPGDGAAVMRELRERSGRRFSLRRGRCIRRCTAWNGTG